MVFLIWSVVAFLVSIVAYASGGFDHLVAGDPNNLGSLPPSIAYLIVICAAIVAGAIGFATFVFHRIWDRSIFFRKHNMMGWAIPHQHKRHSRAWRMDFAKLTKGLRSWRHVANSTSTESEPEKV